MPPQNFISEKPVETTFLVAVARDRAQESEAAESLSELSQLCETAGAVVSDTMITRLARPHPATFIGGGKAMEIGDIVREKNISTVVFDDDLTAAQGRNLEKIIPVKIIDRTQLILDIFAQHARTREGQMQIELAQLEYLLPRLKRMWTHLERQKGGIGLRGPGEKQIEMDRRRILERIVRFRQDLDDVRTRRAELRRGRRRHGWSLISIVGYTNAGKSTLLNALTGSGVLAYDKLFATLDPTTRQLRLPNHQPALITDTVGFIRKLPHHLVESFKATVEEVTEADLLMHVIDTAHPQVDKQIEAVNTVLGELGVHDKKIVHVLNKMDLPDARMHAARLADLLPGSVAVSAITGEGLENLKDMLADLLRDRSHRLVLRIPAAEGRLLAMLRSAASIHEEKYDGDMAVLTASVPPRLLGLCAPYAEGGLPEANRNEDADFDYDDTRAAPVPEP